MNTKIIRKAVIGFCTGVGFACTAFLLLSLGYWPLAILQAIMSLGFMKLVFSGYMIDSSERKAFLKKLVDEEPTRINEDEWKLLRRLEDNDNL